MAYSDPASKSDGDTFDLADYDAFRDNWLASAVKAMNAKGDLVGGTGADALARLAVGDNDSTLVAASGETTGLAWQIQPSCRVYNSGNIDPATSTWVTLTFDSERFDTDTMHSTVTNTGRITVPTDGDGVYLIGACVELEASGGSTTNCGIRILLNGSTAIAKTFDEVAISTNGPAFTLETIYELSATDYITVQVYTSRDLNVLASGNYSPEFWAIWQRRQ